MASNSNDKPVSATAQEDNWRKQFSGKSKFSWVKLRHIFHPKQQWDIGRERLNQDQDLESNKDEHSADVKPADSDRGSVAKQDGRYKYINEYHVESTHFEDVAVYLSPTRSAPRKLIVQATQHVLENDRDIGDWKRARLSGSAPSVLIMSEWALLPFAESEKSRWIRYPMGVARLLLVAIPIQLFLCIPWTRTWEDTDILDSYTEFPGYTWEWPRFAVNKLDRRPLSSEDDAPNELDHRYRRSAPEKLWVKKCGNWELINTSKELGEPIPSYLFVSHTWGDAKSGTSEDKAARCRNQRIAQKVAEKEGFTAFWIDQDCFTQEKGRRLSYDIYTLCDLVRASAQVAVIPSEDSEQGRCTWGHRMWTFMEGLLAPKDEILFCHDDGTLDRLHKVQVAERYWREVSKPNEGGNPVRLLAEHLTGLLTLTNLEFLPVAIAAVASKERRGQFSRSDVAYATMGLLRYRVVQDNRRTFFQSLAQLSLRNDSDNILERMICTLPLPAGMDCGLSAPPSSATEDQHANAFLALQHADQFGTRIHDIEPLCEVVGIADEDEVVMIDNCRAMHIRWKNFPRPAVIRDHGCIRQFVTVLLVTAAYWWATNAAYLAVIYTPVIAEASGSVAERVDQSILSQYLIYSFLGIGFILAVLAPLSVQSLFGGVITKTSPCLVGFEGVIPKADMEKTLFGNCRDRLGYAPSATPLLEKSRDPTERFAEEPDWVSNPNMGRPEIPPNHRLFTLVDIGELTVSIFAAERPPTTALICGREGGMLRVVLCSWRFRNDCLYKETVVRMPSNVLEAAKAKTWTKVCLKSQDQAKRDIAQASKMSEVEKSVH